MRNFYKGMVLGAVIAAASLLTGNITARQAIINSPGGISSLKPLLLTPPSGTGITVNDSGSPLILTTSRVTVTFQAFTAASTTSGFTIATLPAKTRLVHMWADLTQVFACASTCTTSTLTLQGGLTNNGTFLSGFDADAATGQFGLSNATLGSTGATTGANTAPLGAVNNWTSTTLVTLAMVSGTGNIGTGAATNLSQGSVTIYMMFCPTQ